MVNIIAGLTNKYIETILVFLLIYILSVVIIAVNLLRLYHGHITFINISALLAGITLYIIGNTTLLIIILGKTTCNTKN